jgi:hypothetical protein
MSPFHWCFCFSGCSINRNLSSRFEVTANFGALLMRTIQFWKPPNLLKLPLLWVFVFYCFLYISTNRYVQMQWCIWKVCRHIKDTATTSIRNLREFIFISCMSSGCNFLSFSTITVRLPLNISLNTQIALVSC